MIGNISTIERIGNDILAYTARTISTLRVDPSSVNLHKLNVFFRAIVFMPDDIAAGAATISSLRSDLGGEDVDNGEGEGHVA